MELAPDALEAIRNGDRWNSHDQVNFADVRAALEAAGKPLKKRDIGRLLRWRYLDGHNEQFARWVKQGQLKRDFLLRYSLP